MNKLVLATMIMGVSLVALIFGFVILIKVLIG